MRGSAFGRAGKYREAIADFNKAIELDPNFARAYANRALIYRLNGDDSEAAGRLQQRHQRRSALRPGLCRARQHLPPAGPARPGARRLQHRHRSSTPPIRRPSTIAASSIRRRASTSRRSRISPPRSASRPRSAEPYDGRGLSYLALGDARSALDDFNEAVKRDRSSYNAWTNQGLALEALGERQKAFAAFARAANLNSGYQPAKDGMRRTQGGRGLRTPAYRSRHSAAESSKRSAKGRFPKDCHALRPR